MNAIYYLIVFNGCFPGVPLTSPAFRGNVVDFEIILFNEYYINYYSLESSCESRCNYSHFCSMVPGKSRRVRERKSLSLIGTEVNVQGISTTLIGEWHGNGGK